MPAYNAQTVRDLIDANPGDDDAAIAEKCDADPRTVGPIPLDELRALLTGLNVLGRLARAALADNDAANAYAYTSSSNKTIRSDLPDYADQLETMLTGLAPLGVTAEVAAAVIALGGGYRVRGTTPQNVATERAAAARDADWDALNNARYAADKVRSAKLDWIKANPATAIPADLAALDAFAIPAAPTEGEA